MNDENGIFVTEDVPVSRNTIQLPVTVDGLATAEGEITEVTETFLPRIAAGSTITATGQKSDIPGYPTPNLSVVCQRTRASHFIAVRIEDLGSLGDGFAFEDSDGALLMEEGGKILREEEEV